MKNTLLFSLLLCTALSCSGNSTTNSTTSDSDSLNSEGRPDPARATDDEPEEVDYMLVCGSDGVPPVYLFADENDQQIIYWSPINSKPGEGNEDPVQKAARQHLRDYTAAVSGSERFRVSFRSELMPEENEDDWTKGVTTGMIGATLRMSGAFYDFSSPAARKHALGEEGYGASMLLTSETFLKEHPLLSFEYIGDYDDEGRPTPLPADMVSRLEKKYGQQCKRSEIGFRIQDKYLYGVIQFKPQGTKVLALEVLSDGKDLWTEEHWGDCSDGEEGSVWNVDDGGEYFLSSLVAVVQGDEFPILFFTRSAPESTTPGWMTVMDGKFVRATLEAYYMYYQ